MIVAGSIASLKVAVTSLVVGTRAAPLAGSPGVIVGGVVSGPTEFEDDVDQIVLRVERVGPAAGEEPAGSPVLVDAVGAVDPVGERVQRRVVGADEGEVAAAEA